MCRDKVYIDNESWGMADEPWVTGDPREVGA